MPGEIYQSLTFSKKNHVLKLRTFSSYDTRSAFTCFENEDTFKKQDIFVKWLIHMEVCIYYLDVKWLIHMEVCIYYLDAMVLLMNEIQCVHNHGHELQRINQQYQGQ